MKGSQILNNYFILTRKDRTGIITIILLICLTSVSPILLDIISPKKHLARDISWISALKQLEIKQSEKELLANTAKNFTSTYQVDKTRNSYKGQLFYFDPNNASAEDWQKLGLRDKTIQTIQNYTAKGGSFQKPEDLEKIYGLYPDEYERLAPFIKITEKSSTSETNAHTETKPVVKNYTYAAIEINSADTSAFIALPGIGNKLAARIINFREKLGGFYSIEQIGETYALPDSTFQKIKPYLELGTSSIKKININTATAEELKAHPYIKWNIANAIIAYRSQHGSFSNVEDIKKVMIITDEIYNKVSLYLTVQ